MKASYARKAGGSAICKKREENSLAALPIVYLFFIIYLKSIEWTIHKIENLSGCVWRTALVVKKEIFRQKVMLLCFINIPTNQNCIKKEASNILDSITRK